MNRARSIASLFLLPLILGLVPAAAVKAQAAATESDAPLRILSKAAVYDPVKKRVTFTVRFDQRPELLATDADGRLEDQFQYFIIGNPRADYPANLASVVRVEQAWTVQSKLVIRNVLPSSTDPAAGGWGTIRATVPFQLDGDLLRFTAPLSALTATKRVPLRYVLETYSFGALADHVEGRSTTKRRP